MEHELSIYLARFWGLFYLIFGILFIVTKQLGTTIEMTSDRKFVISTGYSTLLMGLISVSVHNIWTWDLRLVITLLGWTAILKAVHKIGFPDSIAVQAEKFKSSQTFATLFFMAIGAWLTYEGFIG